MLSQTDKKAVLWASLTALGLTLCYSILLSSSTTVWLIPVAIAALYAWGGVIPAVLLSVGSIYMTVSLGQTLPDLAGTQAVGMLPAALGALLVLVLPAAAAITAIEKKLPFARRMSVGIASQIGALLLAAGVIYLGAGVDLVDALAKVLRGIVDTVFPPDMAVSVLQIFSTAGLLTKETITDVNTLLGQFEQVDPIQLYAMGYTLSAEQMQLLTGALDQAFESLTYYLKQIMPAVLLHSGLVTGVVMTTLSGFIMKRRDAECALDHKSISTWQVPRQPMGMMIVGLITGIAMQYAGMDQAPAVTTVFSMLLTALLTIQGLAALLRLFERAGVSKGMKIGMPILLFIFAAPMLETAGALSALLGSHGVISLWMKKRMEESRKEDDDE